jgi:hypothetical protein
MRQGLSVVVALGACAASWGHLASAQSDSRPGVDVKSSYVGLYGHAENCCWSVAFATAASPSPAKPPSPTGAWRVTRTVSKKDDSETVTLALGANSAIQAWPGTTTVPVLFARCKEGHIEAYFHLGARPAVEEETDTATITIRLDKESAFEATTDISTNGEAVSLRDPEDFIKSAASHRSAWIRFTPFNSSPQETTFSLRGLSVAAKGLQKACLWNVGLDLAQAAASARGSYSSELAHFSALIETLYDNAAPAERRAEAAKELGVTPWKDRAIVLAPLADVLSTKSQPLVLRIACAEALGSMGPDADGAAASLGTASDAMEAELAIAARTALAKVRPR